MKLSYSRLLLLLVGYSSKHSHTCLGFSPSSLSSQKGIQFRGDTRHDVPSSLKLQLQLQLQLERSLASPVSPLLAIKSNNDYDYGHGYDEPPFPDTFSLNNALHEYAKTKHIKKSTAQKAQDLLFECEHWYTTHIQNGYTILQPIQYKKVMKAAAKNKNGKDTGTNTNTNTDKIIVGPIPDAYSYSSVIDAWAKIGNSEQSIQLLEYMYDIANREEANDNDNDDDNDDDDDDTNENNDNINANGPRNIKPNTIIYNSVINSLCNSIRQGRLSKSSDIESTPFKAQSILEEMKNHIVQQTNLNCIPDTTTYNTVLKVWSNSFRGDCGYHAEKLLNEMWFYHDEYQKYQDKMEHNDNDTDTTDGTGQQEEEKQLQLQLNLTPDQFSYSTTMSAWARSGNSTSAKRAELLLEQMEDYRSRGYDNLAPTTYCVNAVLNAWSKISTKKVNGAAYRAETVLKRMERLYESGLRDELCPNTISYNTVISAYARSGEMGSERGAERILRRMDRLSQSENDDTDTDTNNDSDSDIDNDDKNNSRVDGRRGKHSQFSCKPDIISYNTVINGWSRSKAAEAPKRAESILRHMERQYEKGLSSIQPDVVSYTSCIAAWARSKKPNMAHRAQAILDKMDEAYKAGNVKVKPTVLSYNTVCNAWAKSRDDDAAVQVLSILERMEKMHTNGEMYVKPDIFTYTTCIDTLAKQGTKESAGKALDLLNTIEERYSKTLDTDIKPNVRTYTSVINAISRSKLGPAEAEALLTRIEKLGKETNDRDLHIDVVCFNAVMNAWGWSSEPGKAQRANTIYQKMLDLYKSGQNKDAKPDLITLNSLLNACAFSNLNDEKEAAEAVDIAIKAYEMYQSEVPLYGIPNHLTYGTMLMIFNKLMPQTELRDELMKNLFYHCCEKGHLSGFVVSQLQHGFSDSSLKELFGKAAINDGTNLVIDKRKVPKDWSRYAGGRSRPSKKRSSVDVTKQQIKRSPIA